MATTYEIIDKAILTGSQSSIIFSSIPNTYTDLLIKFSARSAWSAQYDAVYLRFNGSSTANTYSYIYVRGNGSSVNSYGATNNFDAIDMQPIPGSTSTSNTFSNTEIYIPNYTSSNTKSLSIDNVQEDNAATTVFASLIAAGWNNTSAINSITLFAGNGNLVSGSSAYLYGIKNS